MSSEPAPLHWKCYLRIPDGDDERKVYHADLVHMGYNERMVRQLIGGNVAVARDLFANLVPKLDTNRRGKYQDLRLHTQRTGRKTDSEMHRLLADLDLTLTSPADWVFFDPFNPSIDQILNQVEKQDLVVVIKLAFYKPQNGHYLEHNIVSNAIRMISAGSILEGKQLDYTSNGVVLKEDEGSGDSGSMTSIEVMDTDAESDLD